MKHIPFRVPPPPRFHKMECPCRHCCARHPTPSSRDWGDRMAAQVFAGIATALVIAAIIDCVIGGPGLLAAFGF